MNKEKYIELERKVNEAYAQKTPGSKQMYDRAGKAFAGGVSGSSRFFRPYPFYMTHGKGSKTYDVDGNEYIDSFLCNGCLILGHCHPELTEGIKREIERGLLIYNPALGVECAELLKEIAPCAEKVRFANSGTEATMSAVRFARAYTRKNKIIKFYGHYHGQDDQFLVATANNKDDAISLGIPEQSLENTVLLKYNDIDAVRRKLDEDNDIAGVILDPQMNSGGIFPSSPEYLKELRQLTEERGVVLIFDEVITGFRLALGGAQEYFGVIPDLACYAKSMASGAKLAAVVGKEEIMSMAFPKGLTFYEAKGEKTVYQAGTFTDSTMALAAGIATMKVYKKMNERGEYQRLHQLGARLKSGIETTFRERGIGCHVNSQGPALKMFLTDLEPSFDTYCNLDKAALYLFFLSLINEGVVLASPSSGQTFLSFVHTEEDIRRIINAIGSSLDKYNWKEVLYS